MSAAEQLDWGILEEIDPWGQSRLDYLVARIQMVLCRGFGILKKDGTEFVTRDFIPPFPIWGEVSKPTPPKKSQTVEEIESIMRLWVTGNNMVTVERKKRGTRGA
jgi:hypothetical protein